MKTIIIRTKKLVKLKATNMKFLCLKKTKLTNQESFDVEFKQFTKSISKC